MFFKPPSLWYFVTAVEQRQWVSQLFSFCFSSFFHTRNYFFGHILPILIQMDVVAMFENPLETIIGVILQALTKNDKIIYILGILFQKITKQIVLFSFHKIRAAKSNKLAFFFSWQRMWTTIFCSFKILINDLGHCVSKGKTFCNIFLYWTWVFLCWMYLKI